MLQGPFNHIPAAALSLLAVDFARLVLEYGWLGLGAAAFVGATLAPVSSEAAVAAALGLGMPPWQVLLSASVGNALGASLNYGIGRLFTEKVTQRLERRRSGRRALGWMRRYGAWGLLGSWLPLVGDPICLAAGVLRLGAFPFVALGIGTRVLRYAAIVALFGRG